MQRNIRLTFIFILAAIVISNLNCSNKEERVDKQQTKSIQADSVNMSNSNKSRSPASLPEEKIDDKKTEVKEPALKKKMKKAAKNNYEKTSKASAKFPDSVPQDIGDIVDAELQKLNVGKILFNPPAEMKVGTAERVEVRIGKSEIQGFTEGLKGQGKPQIESLKVGTFMQVHLNGQNFEIITLSHEEQLVSSTGFTQWDWDVMPLKSGEQKLELTVTVRIIVANHGVEKKDYPVFERQINVKINPVYSVKKFFKDNWQWIISTILGSGIIGWFTNKYLKKRKKK